MLNGKNFLREGDNVFLIFSKKILPIKIIGSECLTYIYDPIEEMLKRNLKQNEFLEIGILKSDKKELLNSPEGIFRIKNVDIMYQCFMGVAPSYLTVYISQPFFSKQKTMDIIEWSESYPYLTFFNGFESPLLNPSPKSEFFVFYGLIPGFYIKNEILEEITPLFYFIINRLKFNMIKNEELIYDLIKNKKEQKAKIITIGGLTTFDYPIEYHFKIKGIPLDLFIKIQNSNLIEKEELLKQIKMCVSD